MSVMVEARAAQALAAWLRWQLPAKVTAVNLTRAAVLKASTPGPYTIPALGSLQLSLTSKDIFTAVPFASTGSRTATQTAASINGTIPGLASVDADDRLTLTSTNAPTAGTPSLVSVGLETVSGINTCFGWDAGGEFVLNAALVAPSRKGVADGWPIRPDLGPGFWVIIGDRHSNPVAAGPRRDEYIVSLDVAILSKAPPAEQHSSRENISATLQCVRELLSTTAGRQLGAAADGHIVEAEEQSAMVAGRPFQFNVANTVNPTFDAANIKLLVKVFERPALS